MDDSNFDCTKFVRDLTKCNEVLSHVSVLEDERYDPEEAVTVRRY